MHSTLLGDVSGCEWDSKQQCFIWEYLFFFPQVRSVWRIHYWDHSGDPCSVVCVSYLPKHVLEQFRKYETDQVRLKIQIVQTHTQTHIYTPDTGQPGVHILLVFAHQYTSPSVKLFRDGKETIGETDVTSHVLIMSHQPKYWIAEVCVCLCLCVSVWNPTNYIRQRKEGHHLEENVSRHMVIRS